MIEVPASFRAFGRWQREGAAGLRWVEALPEVVAEHCATWHLQVDGAPRHGSNGLAVPVHRGGESLVLKVDWPDRAVIEQIRGLRLWRGRGMVLLVDADPAAGVSLLERLDSGRSLRDLPLAEALPVAGAKLRQLAVPAAIDLPSTWDEALACGSTVRRRWDELGRPFPERLLHAVIEATAVAASHRPPVMVDRDLSYEDVLRGVREPWTALDPRPGVGSIEYQVGQLLWTRYEEVAGAGGVRRCLDALVEAAEMDPDLAEAWALVRCADYWLWGLDAGFTEDPVRCRLVIEGLS